MCILGHFNAFTDSLTTEMLATEISDATSGLAWLTEMMAVKLAVSRISVVKPADDI